MMAETKRLYVAPPDVKTALTPMIDVVFLLLIFFMFGQFRKTEGELITRLPKGGGMVPSAVELQHLAPSEIRINLTIEGSRVRYEVNESRFTDWPSFEQHVRGLAATAEGPAGSMQPIVIIDFADEIPVGVTVRVFDLAKAAGLADVSFAMPRAERQSDQPTP